MKSKIILPILAASLLVTACSAPADTSSKTNASQQKMSKSEKEKINKDIQKVVGDINDIFKSKTYIKKGYFSSNDYIKIEHKLNLVGEALNNKKKLRNDNDEDLIKSLSDQMIRKINELNYDEKKKVLAKLNKSATYYNGIYRDNFYQSLYSFDRDNNFDNQIDSFTNLIATDGVKTKDVIEEADMGYDLSKSQISSWEKEENIFKREYAKNFTKEEADNILSVMDNFIKIEEVNQLLLGNFRLGKQVTADPKEALDKIDELTSKQLKIFNKLNKHYKVSDDFSYDNYVLNEE